MRLWRAFWHFRPCSSTRSNTFANFPTLSVWPSQTPGRPAGSTPVPPCSHFAPLPLHHPYRLHPPLRTRSLLYELLSHCPRLPVHTFPTSLPPFLRSPFACHPTYSDVFCLFAPPFARQLPESCLRFPHHRYIVPILSSSRFLVRPPPHLLQHWVHFTPSLSMFLIAPS